MPKWQGAVEGVLGGYASVVLLEKAKDAPAAYRLAEKERYRHFIVPDCVDGAGRQGRQPAVGGEVFRRQAPGWLIDQLARIDARRFGRRRLQAGQRTTSGSRRTPTTANAAAAARCSWKRRATASAQAGRTQRLEAMQKSLPALEAKEDALTLAISQAGRRSGRPEGAHRRRRRGQGTGGAPGRIRRSARATPRRSRPSAWKWARAWASCKT